MTHILLLLAAGIILGFSTFSKPKWKKSLGVIAYIQQAATIVLLFSMGIWLGNNTEFWNNLQTIGWHGLLFGLFGVLGSVVGVTLLVHISMKRRNNPQ